MRASHKKRIARLIETLDEVEEQAFHQRCLRRFEALVCEDIRMAMEWRGIDPKTCRALVDAEARVPRFVDTPELRAADAAVLARQHARAQASGEDPWAECIEKMDRRGRRHLDGSRPNFTFETLVGIWAWAVYQPSLLPAIRYDFTAASDERRDGAPGAS